MLLIFHESPYHGEEWIDVGYREGEVRQEEGLKEELLLEYKIKKKKTSEGGYQCLVFTCLSSIDSIQDNTGRKQTH